MKFASNSVQTGLMTGFFPDLGISIILNSDQYLARAEGGMPKPQSNTRPTEEHFVAFIKGIGLLDGTLHGDMNSGR